MIGWLRFVPAEDGQSVYAGLLETSATGDPLGFSFVRGTPQGTEDECGLPSLAQALFRSCVTAPTLFVGFAEELPSRQLPALNTKVPFCRVDRAEPNHTDDSGPEPSISAVHQVFWANGEPGGHSAASEALNLVMERPDPFEPMKRTGRALTEAFADDRVRAAMGISGLKTVISLQPHSGPRPMSGSANSGFASPVARAQGGMERDLAGRLWATLAAPLPVGPSGPPGTALEWPAELMPFQREGVHALITMDRLLLSDDMGLGKTVQAVAALRILRALGKIGSGLVVTPASLLDQWRQELKRWAPELSAIIIRGGANDRTWQWKARKDITLASYDVLRQDARYLAERRTHGNTCWGVVVLDEAQRIKNRNDTSEIVKNIPRQRSWALTGTPIENDEYELASIMEFVDHHEGAPRKRYSPGTALRERHRALQLRRKKVDVLQDLPPKLETHLTVPLHRDQRESYDRAEREGIVYLKSLGSDIGIQHVLELITRLKQICNADPRTGASSKLDDISSRLGALTAQGHKALIFSQYTNDTSGVAAAANHLRAFNPLTLTGETPAEVRAEVISRFRTGETHKALVVSLRAGGLGLNLQEASYVFHLDRWWNPAVERQAEDRSHRMGQTVKVNVIKYTCEKTIEQRIDKILREKQALFDELIDDVSLDLSTRMNRKELLDLFDLG